MSKKSRKARRPNIPLHVGPVLPAAAAGSAPETSKPAANRESINADYTHIVNDLKRIGVLAGSLIAILVVLSFFIK